MNEQPSRIDPEDLHPKIRAKLSKGFYSEMSDEEREGSLLGFNPHVHLNLQDPDQLGSVFELLLTPGKIEPETEKIFTHHLLHRYGFWFTDEMFDRILVAFPPVDFYDRDFTHTVDRMRPVAKSIREEA